MKKDGKINSKKISTFCTLSKINKKMIDFCKVLSDPTRFQIVSLLRNGALPVQEIAEMLNQSDSNVSHQLRLLKLHRVVEGKRVERFRLYALTESFKEKLLPFLGLY